MNYCYIVLVLKKKNEIHEFVLMKIKIKLIITMNCNLLNALMMIKIEVCLIVILKMKEEIGMANWKILNFSYC